METEEDLEPTEAEIEQECREFELSYRKYCFDKVVEVFRVTLHQFDYDLEFGYARRDPQVILGAALAVAISERGFQPECKRQGILASDREALLLDSPECAWCGSTENLEVDHVRPVTLGGSSNLENLQVLCLPCNRAKKNRFAG